VGVGVGVAWVRVSALSSGGEPQHVTIMLYHAIGELAGLAQRRFRALFLERKGMSQSRWKGEREQARCQYQQFASRGGTSMWAPIIYVGANYLCGRQLSMLVHRSCAFPILREVCLVSERASA